MRQDLQSTGYISNDIIQWLYKTLRRCSFRSGILILLVIFLFFFSSKSIFHDRPTSHQSPITLLHWLFIHVEYDKMSPNKNGETTWNEISNLHRTSPVGFWIVLRTRFEIASFLLLRFRFQDSTKRNRQLATLNVIEQPVSLQIGHSAVAHSSDSSTKRLFVSGEAIEVCYATSMACHLQD